MRIHSAPSTHERLRSAALPSTRSRAPLAVAFALLAASCVLADTLGPPLAHADGEQVFTSHARLVCRLPRSGNKQRVHGFDGGFSFVHNGSAYWSFGDSRIDGNGDGWVQQDEILGFRAGSIGRTKDRTAHNCIDVRLRTTTGRDALPALKPDKAHGECTIWPSQVFEADSKLYFFYGQYFQLPDCAKGRPVTYGIGLGQITEPSTNDLKPVRAAGDTQWSFYLSPLKIGSHVYVFRLGPSWGLFVARVDERFVTSLASYEYWNGSTWDANEASASPIGTLEPLATSPHIAYNSYVGRYMMLYACDELKKLCARTARIPGSSVAALLGGWNDTTHLLACGLCAHTHWHVGYADPRRPHRIYVTTGRFPGRAQYLSLWEIDLSLVPAPATRSLHYAGFELYVNGPGATAWSYASYSLTEPGAGVVPLLIPGFSPPDPDGFRYNSYVGSETVNGGAAPGGFAIGVWPSATRGGAIVWTAPGDGTAEISGSLWREATLGDDAMADILLVRGTTFVKKLWSKPLATTWKPSRQRDVRLRRSVRVLAGDRILFGVRAGIRPASTPLHDLTFVDQTITFDAD